MFQQTSVCSNLFQRTTVLPPATIKHIWYNDTAIIFQLCSSFTITNAQDCSNRGVYWINSNTRLPPINCIIWYSSGPLEQLQEPWLYSLLNLHTEWMQCNYFIVHWLYFILLQALLDSILWFSYCIWWKDLWLYFLQHSLANWFRE